MPRVHRHRVDAPTAAGVAGSVSGCALKGGPIPKAGATPAVPKRPRRVRLAVQAAAAVFFNGYLAGFAQGKIFTGPTKAVCVPVLNCYSCPGALGACPIGALQNALGGMWRHIPFYVLGSLMLFGIVLGRLICGFLCPFGFVQDLLHKIPVRKFRVPRRVDRALRWVKYVMLFGVVVFLSLAITTKAGVTPPFFCEYVCPAGTLGAAIPLLLANEELRAVAGALFDWKFLVLVAVVVAAVFIPRPFCRYLCPLGAFYGLFNRFSFYRLHVNMDRCIGCGRCDRVCPMDVRVRRTPNSPECIRCGSCKHVCPTDAIVSSWEWSLRPDGARTAAPAAERPAK